MQAVGKDERQLDREGLEQIWQYYRKDALLCTCKEVLRRQLFSEGIDFCVGHCSKKRKRSSTLVQQELIDDYWMPFALDALDCLLVMGVVPVALLEVNGSLLPVVPPFGTYTLSRVFDSETMTMGFEAKPATALPGSSEIELFVLGNYGYDPTYDCSLSSLVSCICSEVSYLKTARLQAMVRGELCNHPVLFAQSDPQKVDSETGLSVDFWANTEDGTLRSNPESTFRRNREEQSIYATQRRVYDAARRGRAIGVSPANAKPNLITLPPGQKIHQARLSNGNIDVTAATKIYEQTACALLGIPRSMLVNDSAVKADVEGTHSMFRRTVLHWSRLLGRVLSEVHSRIPNDAASNKVTSKMSREELYTLKEKEGEIMQDVPGWEAGASVYKTRYMSPMDLVGVMAMGNRDKTLDMECPAGMRMDSVIFASYGRPENGCNTDYRTECDDTETLIPCDYTQFAEHKDRKSVV